MVPSTPARFAPRRARPGMQRSRRRRGKQQPCCGARAARAEPWTVTDDARFGAPSYGEDHDGACRSESKLPISINRADAYAVLGKIFVHRKIDLPPSGGHAYQRDPTIRCYFRRKTTYAKTHDLTALYH